MGGELVKSTEINNKSSRNMVAISDRSFKTTYLKAASIKTPKNCSFSYNKNKRKNQKISLVAKNKIKEKEVLELIQNKNKQKKDYQLLYESLEKHFFMKNLGEQARNEIITNMSLYKLSSGTCLYSQGSIGYFWYIVSEGKLNYIVDDKQKNYLKKEIILVKLH